MTNSVKNLLLVLWAIITTLVVAEVVLSYLDIPHIYKSHSTPPQFRFFSEVEKYKDIGYLNVPSTGIRYVYDGNPRGYFGPYNEVVHTTNSIGLRERQNLPAHTSNTFRIAVLGDSFTFGEGVHDSDTYTRQLEKILSEKYPGKKIQALNFGVGGYNTVQAAEMLRLFGKGVQPDMVVLGYTTNDAHPMLYYFNSNTRKFVRRTTPLLTIGSKSSNPPATPLYQYSRIAQLIWIATSKSGKNDHLLEIFRDMYREDNVDWIQSKQAMGKINGICSELKIPCYAVVFPILNDLENYRLQQQHDQIMAALKDNSFEVVDLLPPLKTLNIPATDLWVHQTDHHPNEIVHRLVAELLAERVIDKGLLK